MLFEGVETLNTDCGKKEKKLTKSCISKITKYIAIAAAVLHANNGNHKLK